MKKLLALCLFVAAVGGVGLLALLLYVIIGVSQISGERVRGQYLDKSLEEKNNEMKSRTK